MYISEINRVGFKRSILFSSEFGKLNSNLTQKVIFQTPSFSNLNKHSSQHMYPESCVSVIQNAPDTGQNPLTSDISPFFETSLTMAPSLNSQRRTTHHRAVCAFQTSVRIASPVASTPDSTDDHTPT